MSVTVFRKLALFNNAQKFAKLFETRGFHQGAACYFMHERHANVEENRKRIGIVGGSVCAGQVRSFNLNHFDVKI